MLLRKDPELKLYCFLSQCLLVQQGFFLYQLRFAIPAELVNGMLDRLHEEHQDIKFQGLAGNTAWWPGLINQIAKKLRVCHT